MKNFIKTYLAGLYSILVHVGLLLGYVLIVSGFISIKDLKPWAAIFAFISVVVIGIAIVACTYLAGKLAKGQSQLVGQSRPDCDCCENRNAVTLVENYEKVHNTLLDDFHAALHYADKNSNICSLCARDTGEGGEPCKGKECSIYCNPKWRGVRPDSFDNEG